MENNELQNAWRKIDNAISPNSKDELNQILISKTNSTMNKYLYYISVSALISITFLTFILITMINRWDDIYYRIINLLVCLFTIFSLISSVKTFFILNINKTDIPLKDWLKQRIEMISKGIDSKIVFYILPFICMLIILSIHVYFENKLFIDVVKTEDSIIALVVGFVVGSTVSYISLKQIRNQQRNNLELLKEIYKNLTN